MHLYLSHRSPLHSVFTNEDGQAIFKVQAPMKIAGRTATITRVVPNDISEPDNMHDRYAHLAEIKFRTIASSVMRFGGDEIATKDYFRKEGWGWYGRHRVFTAPDGREYKWLLGSFTSELILNDGTKTSVARFHRRSLGIVGKAHRASLEIFQAGEHMVDMIMITFIYIEKRRKDKERAAKHQGGGGGP